MECISGIDDEYPHPLIDSALVIWLRKISRPVREKAKLLTVTPEYSTLNFVCDNQKTTTTRLLRSRTFAFGWRLLWWWWGFSVSLNLITELILSLFLSESSAILAPMSYVPQSKVYLVIDQRIKINLLRVLINYYRWLRALSGIQRLPVNCRLLRLCICIAIK